MEPSTGQSETLGEHITVRAALSVSSVALIILLLSLIAHGQHQSTLGAILGGIIQLRLSRMTLETRNTRHLYLSIKNPKNSSKREDRPARELNATNSRWVRNAPQRWHGKRLNKVHSPKTGTGEILAESTTYHGLAINTSPSTVALAGLTVLLQHLLIASISS
jgi:hypothetical protein